MLISTERLNAPIRTQAGIGLRAVHHAEILQARPPIGWVEVHAENYMGGGAPVRVLERVRRDYGVSLHGIGHGEQRSEEHTSELQSH